jgi:hypothetical protein
MVPVLDEARVNRESFYQHLARVRGRARERLHLRPRPLGIDVIGRDRGDAAPVVDPSGDQLLEGARLQIGRGLDVHCRAEHEARNGDRPDVFGKRRFGVMRHAGARLGAKILDDEFLQVSVAPMQLAKQQQRFDPLTAGLADAQLVAAHEFVSKN